MVSEEKGKTKILSIIVPIACAIIFMGLCMIGLRNSIWFDEAYSAYLIRGNFSDIWNLTAIDVHPPIYYFCLKVWSLFFGTSDVALRFMSVFFGALSIIFMFHLLKRWFDVKVSSVATFFLSLSPMFIRYGQEMRMYTLVFFIVVLATYVLELALDTKKTRYYILYAILIALGMWTQYLTAIAWLAHIIYYMVTRRGKIWDKKFLGTYALAVVLFIAWIPFFLKQTNSVQGGFWIPELSFSTAAGYVSEALIFKDAGSASNWLVILLIATIFAVIFAAAKIYKNFKSSEKSGFLFLLSLVALPPITLMLLSVPPFKPIFVSRYVTYAAALLWALIGVIVAKKVCASPRAAKKSKTVMHIICSVVLVLLTLGTAILGVVNVETRETEGHAKQAVLSVSAISEENVPIVPYDEWSYYDTIFYSTDAHPVYGLNSLVNIPYDSFRPIEQYKYNLVDSDEDFLADKNHVWYMIKTSELPEDMSEFALPEVFKDYHIVSDISDQYYTSFLLEK